ncbi:MAG: SPFH domain-containing protein [Lachnospirales bacterium]
MGLIKSAFSSAGSVMADQWKEYFYCDSLDSNVIIKKGKKKNSKNNNNGNDDIITSGSIIIINEGQAMMIVDNGEIVEFSAEAGEFTYDSSTEQSCFSGSFSSGLKSSFSEFKKRFTYGGETPRTQRVYYINTKELTGRKFGSSAPVVYDDPVYQSISIRYFGVASLKIVDPIKFYVNVCGNINNEFNISSYWENQLLHEFGSTLSQSLARLAIDGKKYTQIPQSQSEISKYMNDILDDEWINIRGFEIVSVAISQVTLNPEDREKVNKIDDMLLLSNANMAAGRLAGAQATSMENAAKNSGGAMVGFAGMNMAMNAGGINATNLFNQQQPQNAAPPQGNLWKCSCGNENTGKFCSNCGERQPENNSWTCTCGSSNTGKFCSNCGEKQPESSSWACSCGNKVIGNFCSNCGKKK